MTMNMNMMAQMMPNMGAMGAMGMPPMMGMGGMNAGQMAGMNPGQMQGGQGTTLYIGNLSPETADNRLYEVFSQYGSLTSARVMRDMYTGDSRKFAFVTFMNAADSDRAKQVLNHTEIDGSVIRISMKRSPTELNPEANLYISGLDNAITEKELEERCSDDGTIVSCRLKFQPEKNTNATNYGYVQFDTVENAKKCIERLDGFKIGQHEVKVEVFVPSHKRASSIKQSNLYLKDFPKAWGVEQATKFIEDKFSAFGKISSKSVQLNTKLNMVYAFVAYESADEAKAAHEQMSNYQFEDETKIYVNFAQSKAQRQKQLQQEHQNIKNDTNLYIKYLNDQVTEEQLKRVMEKYGEVISVSVKESKGKPGQEPAADQPKLKFGFCNFKTAESANDALGKSKEDQEFLSLLHSSRGTHEFICFFQSKKLRSQYLRMKQKNIATQKYIEAQKMVYEQMLRQMGMGNQNRRPRQQPFRQQQNRGGNQVNLPRANKPMGQQGGFPGGFQQPFNFQQPPMNIQPLQSASNMNLEPVANLNQTALNANPTAITTANNPLAGLTQPKATEVTHNLQWLQNNTEAFTQMESQQQKNILGNLMFPKVQQLCVGTENEEHIPKITGMLIDLEVLEIAEITEIISDSESLKERIEEAMEIIKEDGTD